MTTDQDIHQWTGGTRHLEDQEHGLATGTLKAFQQTATTKAESPIKTKSTATIQQTTSNRHVPTHSQVNTKTGTNESPQ